MNVVNVSDYYECSAIRARGGWVAYDYQIVNGQFDAKSRSKVPDWLRHVLGDDFFHRVISVQLIVLDPPDWERREKETLSKFLSSNWRPTVANDCVMLALHEQHMCGGMQVDDFCHEALRVDPRCVEANLLLAERRVRSDECPDARPYLEAVMQDSAPQSLEHAHAQKLLAEEQWTFDELCQRVGEDGVLR